MLDREKIIKNFEDYEPYARNLSAISMLSSDYFDMLDLLKEQETKTGHWIDTTKVIGFPRVQCSVCGSGQGAIWMNHCPNCGAKMEGGDV